MMYVYCSCGGSTCFKLALRSFHCMGALEGGLVGGCGSSECVLSPSFVSAVSLSFVSVLLE